jgi:hypothetical protein
MFKKMTMLVVAAAAVAAFVVPATASADSWAHNGVKLGAGIDMTQNYEGVLGFDTGPTGKFTCPVTVTITTSGPSQATITKFSPTTTECHGTIAFEGCHLIAHKTNLPAWEINNAATPLVVTKTGGNLTIHNEYEPGSCKGAQTTSHLEFKEVKVAVEGTNPIQKLTISGTATNGVPVSGSLTPHFPIPATLGIIN